MTLSSVLILIQFDEPTTLPKRPAAGNKTGKEVDIRLNSFEVMAFPSKPVWQYDVSTHV